MTSVVLLKASSLMYVLLVNAKSGNLMPIFFIIFTFIFIEFILIQLDIKTERSDAR